MSRIWTRYLTDLFLFRKREIVHDTRFIALFYVKNEVSTETIFIFIFYCATVSRENWMKLAVLFSDYFGIKNETGWWFHNFSPLNYETTPSFIFEPKNPKTKPPVSFSFTWNCSFSQFYAKKPLFFVPSFTETRHLILVSDQFQWNWSETKIGFIWILENPPYCCKNTIFELKSLHRNF